MMKKLLLRLPLLAAMWVATSAYAQTSTAANPTQALATVMDPTLEGRTLDGKPFALSALKGKVVLLMFWATDCAVCRDKMPELRQNYEGWMGKPFEMVLVSHDKRVKDLDDYEKIINSTVPVKQRFVQVWAGEPRYRDNMGKPAQLPSALLIDKKGKVVERYMGRMPADAWDKIAELL
jgi:cytochrome oxidase Cu insertion factor (SCO1/SenC/PrrC family)